MDSRPSLPALGEGAQSNLPAIQKKLKAKGLPNGKPKTSTSERLQPVKSSNQNQAQSSPFRDAVENNNISVISVSSTVIGDEDTQKVELLREGYFKSKMRADEYMLLVAAEKESLSARGWVAGEDLYSFKSRSNEKKQQFHQANRLYYGLSTLLYASIGAMKANELDVYVRRKALLLPETIFDIREWEQFLLLAKECRSKEWKEAHDATAKEIRQDVTQDLNTSLTGCLEKTYRLRTDASILKREVRQQSAELNEYIKGTAKRLETVLQALNNKLGDTNYAFESALASAEEEKEKHRLFLLQKDEEKNAQIETLQIEFEDKLKSIRKGHETELSEKEDQRIFLSRENEDLAALQEKNALQHQALETKITFIEMANAVSQLKVQKMEDDEEGRKKAAFDLEVEQKLKSTAEDDYADPEWDTDDGQNPITLNSKHTDNGQHNESKWNSGEGHNPVASGGGRPPLASKPYQPCQQCVSLEARIAQLEGELEVAKARQAMRDSKIVELAIVISSSKDLLKSEKSESVREVTVEKSEVNTGKVGNVEKVQEAKKVEAEVGRVKGHPDLHVNIEEYSERVNEEYSEKFSDTEETPKGTANSADERDPGPSANREEAVRTVSYEEATVMGATVVHAAGGQMEKEEVRGAPVTTAAELEVEVTREKEVVSRVEEVPLKTAALSGKEREDRVDLDELEALMAAAMDGEGEEGSLRDEKEEVEHEGKPGDVVVQEGGTFSIAVDVEAEEEEEEVVVKEDIGTDAERAGKGEEVVNGEVAAPVSAPVEMGMESEAGLEEVDDKVTVAEGSVAAAAAAVEVEAAVISGIETFELGDGNEGDSPVVAEVAVKVTEAVVENELETVSALEEDVEHTIEDKAEDEFKISEGSEVEDKEKKMPLADAVADTVDVTVSTEAKEGVEIEGSSEGVVGATGATAVACVDDLQEKEDKEEEIEKEEKEEKEAEKEVVVTKEEEIIVTDEERALLKLELERVEEERLLEEARLEEAQDAREKEQWEVKIRGKEELVVIEAKKAEVRRKSIIIADTKVFSFDEDEKNKNNTEGTEVAEGKDEAVDKRNRSDDGEEKAEKVMGDLLAVRDWEDSEGEESKFNSIQKGTKDENNIGEFSATSPGIQEGRDKGGESDEEKGEGKAEEKADEPVKSEEEIMMELDSIKQKTIEELKIFITNEKEREEAAVAEAMRAAEELEMMSAKYEKEQLLQREREEVNRRKISEVNRINAERERVCREVGYRVLSVQADGPAAKGGLRPSEDLIVAAKGVRLRALDSALVDFIKASEDKELPLVVYNCLSQAEREVTLVPTRKWPGKGLLGATIRFEGYHEEDEEPPAYNNDIGKGDIETGNA